MIEIERLANRPTRYELAVKHTDGREYLLSYCFRKTRRTILNIAYKFGPELVKLTGTEDITFAKKATAGATMGEWKIVWTGRTQRNAYSEGELTFILNVT